MITVKNIESLLTKIDYTKPEPSEDQLAALMLDGRSRILKSAEIEGFCELSARYFEFCLTQVGSFCTAPYNAVEIALVTGIQPIYVAAAIKLYGCDWAHKLFGLKRFAMLDRGEYTVWRSGTAWFALGETRRRSKRLNGDLSTAQYALRRALRDGNMAEIARMSDAYPSRILSLMNMREGMLYADPRHLQTKKQLREAQDAAKAENRSFVHLQTRSEFGDLQYAFNGPMQKSNPARPRTCGIEYETTTGRKYTFS